MSRQKILIVEDEKNILELVKYNLEKENFSVITAADGKIGLELALRDLPSLIILDGMLPSMDGVDVCKTLKRNSKTIHIPIIFLTARGEEIDRVLGLELGADDYVTKPFSPRELIARIKAVLRRVEIKKATSILEVGALKIDLEKHVVSLDNEKIELTSKEFSLLKTLMEADGRVLSREVLLEQVWGIDRAVHIETRTVDMHVGQLRKKIKTEAFRILTVKNSGYRFDHEA
jgi:two-component system alkaline phosphatase synthesis response regulator PhoP